jgi:hypothetical protein
VLLRLIVALVLAGLGLLWAGAVRDSLGLIYLSILCTAIAGVGLIVYVKVSRRQAAPLVTGGDARAWRAQQDAAAAAGRPESTAAPDAESPPVPAPGGLAPDQPPSGAVPGPDNPSLASPAGAPSEAGSARGPGPRDDPDPPDSTSPGAEAPPHG